MFRGNNPNSFAPDGRILQMQYACEASKLGATSIGICTEEALILAAEKRQVSPLMVAGALDRIVKLDGHIYCTISGLPADARSLIDPARLACCNYCLEYNAQMPIERLMESMALQATSFGRGAEDTAGNSSSSSDNDSSSSSDSNEESDDENKKLLTTCRPYGAAFLFGGIDNDQLQLWHLDPTGEFGQHGIKAIGSGSDVANNWLKRHYKPKMEMSQVMALALRTMQLVIGEQPLTSDHLDVIVMSKGPGQRFHLLTGKELEQEIVGCLGLGKY